MDLRLCSLGTACIVLPAVEAPIYEPLNATPTYSLTGLLPLAVVVLTIIRVTSSGLVCRGR